MDSETNEQTEREKRIDQILAKGIREEHITKQDLLQVVSQDGNGDEELEALTAALGEMGIPVLDLDDEEEEEDLLIEEDQSAEDEDAYLHSEPVNDPVHMYLREIGRVPLLDAEEEVRLARAIYNGFEATARKEEEGDQLSTVENQILSLKIMQGDLARAAWPKPTLRSWW
jgi:RNA polymerase primary sigma factor